jgi:hypothetical protein
MGNPAIGSGTIKFKGGINIQETILEWIEQANSGQLDGEFDIRLQEVYINGIDFYIPANRSLNLAFQMEELSNFLKTIPHVYSLMTTEVDTEENTSWER